MHRAAKSFLASLCLLIGGTANSEIVTQTFDTIEWGKCGIRCKSIDLEADLGFGVSNVDSVWITISGLAHVGEQSMDQNGEMVSYTCVDDLLLSFEGEQDQGYCDSNDTTQDGEMDCIGAFYEPTGDLVPFDVTLYLSGLDGRVIMDPRPFLGGLFSTGEARLRIVRIDGGTISNCSGGLAEIFDVTINVAYDPSLPVVHEQWGAFKARFR